MIDARNGPISDHLLQDIIFCPFDIEFQDDVVEDARVFAEPSRKVDGSHLDRVHGIECPKATILTSQFVPEESASVAVFPVQEKVLKSLSIVNRRLK